MPKHKDTETLKVEIYLKSHELITTQELYKAFPTMRQDRLRRIKFEFFKAKELEDTLAGRTNGPTLKSIETDDVIAEVLRIYNLSNDATKISMMRTSILDLWKYKHRVPAHITEEESLGDILRELQKPSKTAQTSSSAESSDH